MDYARILSLRMTDALRVAEAAARYADARHRVVLIAGANGAGKTTFARQYLPREGTCFAFVNADEIAAGIAPLSPEAAAVTAGKLMIRQIYDHARRRRSFAVETTLTGRRYARLIPQWRADGYGVKLVFLHLPEVEMAISRVAARVEAGGHNIPEAAIRRRFARGWELFNSLYRPLVDAWAVYDSSKPVPELLDEGENS